ncbi:MAG: hypothetical protein M3P29_04930, partial [Acidobacteriota bacterium]|nr:hypothetical protein [Acidobacteriota bacterium]
MILLLPKRHAKCASQSMRRHRFGDRIITGDSKTADAPRSLLAHRAFGTLTQCQWPSEVLPMSPVYFVTH